MNHDNTKSCCHGHDHDAEKVAKPLPAGVNAADIIYTCPMHPQVRQK